MISYFVTYTGDSSKAESLIRYYAEHHVPLLLRFPGIRDVILHVPCPSPDPLPTDAGGAILMAQMVFEDEASLRDALASEPRIAARRDMANFPAIGFTCRHQSFRSESLGHAS